LSQLGENGACAPYNQPIAEWRRGTVWRVFVTFIVEVLGSSNVMRAYCTRREAHWSDDAPSAAHLISFIEANGQ
jgi:hypothetical protein